MEGPTSSPGWRIEQLANFIVSDLMEVGVNLSDGLERGWHGRANHVIGFPRKFAAD